MYRSARRTYPPRKTVTGPRANKFAGDCATCGEHVPAGAGILGGYSGSWTVKHRPAEWSGSPVSGWYINGCPADTAKLNAAGGWGPEHVRAYAPTQAPDQLLAMARDAELAYGQYVADGRAPRQVDPSSAREASRRAGGKYAYTASGARMTVSSRRCEDAPCCGCCD